MIVLHGVPGNERNFDLAHAYRRAGINALIFHPRGAWGSHGTFSFQHVLDDVPAALTWLRSGEVASRFRVDPDRIGLVGHSLGGFAALITAARDSSLRCAVSISGANLGAWWKTLEHDANQIRALEDGLHGLALPLSGATGVGLAGEMRAHAVDWDLTAHADALARRTLLLIAGARDDDLPPALHHDPLVRALQQRGSSVQHAMLETDHAFADQRIALARVTLGFLRARLLG